MGIVGVINQKKAKQTIGFGLLCVSGAYWLVDVLKGAIARKLESNFLKSAF